MLLIKDLNQSNEAPPLTGLPLGEGQLTHLQDGATFDPAAAELPVRCAALSGVLACRSSSCQVGGAKRGSLPQLRFGPHVPSAAQKQVASRVLTWSNMMTREGVITSLTGPAPRTNVHLHTYLNRDIHTYLLYMAIHSLP